MRRTIGFKKWAFMMFDTSSTATYSTRAMSPKLGWLLAGLLIIPTPLLGQDLAQESGQTEVTAETTVPETTTTEVIEEGGKPEKRADALRSDELVIELPAVRANQLSNDEKRKKSERMLTRQRAGLALVTDLTADARARKDIFQLNCVNGKRLQLKGLLKLSQQAANAMFEGMATGTEDVVNHEYTKIAVASQRAVLIVRDAKQCVGEEAIFAGDTTVDIEISSDIPTTDPTLPAAPPLGPSAPPVASGF